uniref:Uncharacterized protein n=1 Tax=Octopus bimaculoides TaxID=37653 RepID=A0A0L8HYZ7_OCTBM
MVKWYSMVRRGKELLCSSPYEGKMKMNASRSKVVRGIKIKDRWLKGMYWIYIVQYIYCSVVFIPEEE